MKLFLVFWLVKSICSYLHIVAIKYHHSLLGSNIETDLVKEITIALIHLSPVPILVGLIFTLIYYFLSSQEENKNPEN